MSLLLIGLLAASSGIVVLEQPRDAELLRRVIGQVSDLGRTIEVEARTSTVSDPMTHARQLATHRDVHAVVWLDEAANGFAVTVVHLASGRLLLREVAPVRDPKHGASATKEAVALIVRSSLQAMDAWRAHEEPNVEAPPAIAREEAAPIEPAPSLAFEGALGWTAAADGGSFGPHGPRLRLALRGSIWSAGVELATDLPERVTDELTTIELVRYRAGVGASIDPFQLGPLSLGAAASIGSSIHRRSTVSTANGVTATPPTTTVALALGAEVRVGYGFEVLGGMLGIELAGGADFFIGRPALAYRREEEVIERSRPWLAQPYGRIGLFFRSGGALTRSGAGAPL